MSARPDLLDVLPFADVADPDPNVLPFADEPDWEPGDNRTFPPHPFRESRREPGWCGVCGESPSSPVSHGPVPGWASVRDGKWHRTLGGDPADFRTPVGTVCGITITPYNVGESNVNPRHTCKRCQP